MRPSAIALVACTVAAAAFGQTTRPASLARPMPELRFDGIALSDALDFFRDATGANLVVEWPAITAAGVDKTTPVSLRLYRPVFRTALRQTLEAAAPGKLAFYVDGNVLYVTTRDVADARLVTRVYLVGDLLNDVPDYTGPELSLSNSSTSSRSGGSGGGGAGGGSNTNLFGGGAQAANAARPAVGRDAKLIETIESTVRPEVWDVNGGKSTIRILNGKMIVTAPIDVQELIGGR